MGRGARVVEIGCGPHGCLELLSERVGPSGRVVGVERSADAVALARKLVPERGLGNVEVLEGDARSTGLPRASFDLATSRLVLVNVPQPEQIVAEAAALVRPGGWVAFHEADYVSHVCDPPLDAWTSLVELLQMYSEKNGIDPFIGRKLPRLLREAGLIEVRVNPIVHVYPPGHGRRSILLDFAENLSERILAQKLVGERELTDMKARSRAAPCQPRHARRLTPLPSGMGPQAARVAPYPALSSDAADATLIKILGRLTRDVVRACQRTSTGFIMPLIDRPIDIDCTSPPFDQFKGIQWLARDRSGHGSAGHARHHLYVGRDKHSPSRVLIKLSVKPGLIYQANLDQRNRESVDDQPGAAGLALLSDRRRNTGRCVTAASI